MSSEEEDEKRRAAPVAFGKLRPEVQLLMHQLQSSVPSGYGKDLRQSLVKGTMDFYDGFKAKDRIETLLIRHIVILNNLATECLQRGMNTGKPEARAVDLRSGLKAISLIAELTKMLERRRERGQQSLSGAAGPAKSANVELTLEPGPTSEAIEADETAKVGSNTSPKAA